MIGQYVAKSPDKIWRRLRHLFETDDGSRPDTFIVGLNAEECVDKTSLQGGVRNFYRANTF